MATISGIWYWNETITKPKGLTSNGSYEFRVNFAYKNAAGDFAECSRMKENRGSSGHDLSFYKVADNYYTGGFYKWSGSPLGWGHENYRHIDFGKAEQEVSDEFYTWFTSNAVKSISGVQFDLSTLNLTGTHSITVKAKANGYMSSPASEAVVYIVG